METMDTGTHAYELRSQPAHTLSQRVITELFALVRAETELCMLEMEKSGRAGITAARSFAFASFFGVAAIVSLGIAIAGLLATVVDAWLAALIVAAVYAVVGALLAATGRTALGCATAHSMPRPLARLYDEARARTHPIPDAEARVEGARNDLDRTLASLQQRTSGPSPVRDAILTDLAMTMGTV